MPNHFMKLWKRGLALLLAGVLLFSNLSGSLAFAESTPPRKKPRRLPPKRRKPLTQPR